MRFFKNLHRHTDARGYIQELLPESVKVSSIAYITGKKGAIRGNHTHINGEAHYCYVLKGTLKYSYRETEYARLQTKTMKEGEVVYSDSNEWHQFTFMTAGVFIAMSLKRRDSKTYERNTVHKEK